MKLELYNYLRDTTPHAKFQGSMSTWVVWANSQLKHESFCPYFLPSSRPHPTHNTSLYVVPAKEVLFWD